MRALLAGGSKHAGRLGLTALALCLSLGQMNAPAQAADGPARLPAPVAAALFKAQVPASAVSLLVTDVSGQQLPRLSHRADAAMNPASAMKLVTTYAALDLLGPQFTWITTALADGALRNDELEGNLLLRGGGDPKLVVERLQAFLAQVQASGVRTVRGDIVLDRSAFALRTLAAGDFDGEPLRPYNTQPDALLINFKTLVMTFTPDPARGLALVRHEPPLSGVAVDASVPLAPTSARCGDWRSDLRASVDNAQRVQFSGHYPAACGERVWPSAYADPASFAARAVEGSWRLLGGQLSGRVRDASADELARWQRSGSASGQRVPLRLELASLPLRDIVHDINKFSNNVMAQQLFLTLGLQGQRSQADGTLAAGRAAVQAWWQKTLPGQAAPVLDNGSGLSRIERISASSLAGLLQHAAHSPVAGELLASLPVAGVDATMRERVKGAAGQAFIKTGSLRDVSAVAGYVLGADGARYAVVGIINHPNAGAGRAALDALIQWVALQR
jgi:D-alanyl-D-alanine carboxypeptidase/D-alanyl-D-alanine-endopeptidase (penicillin-binding protein 4)